MRFVDSQEQVSEVTFQLKSSQPAARWLAAELGFCAEFHAIAKTVQSPRALSQYREDPTMPDTCMLRRRT
jgi:hypothetical protein